MGKRGSMRERDSEGMSEGTQCRERAQQGDGLNGGSSRDCMGGLRGGGSGVQGGGAEKPPVSGVQDQMWSGEPLLGLKMFILKDTVLTQAGAGRRGWGGRCNDHCHPLPDRTSMRMPMRMSLWRRAGCGAPPCDPTRLWPPAPTLGARNQCPSSEQESTVTGRLLQSDPALNCPSQCQNSDCV